MKKHIVDKTSEKVKLCQRFLRRKLLVKEQMFRLNDSEGRVTET